MKRSELFKLLARLGMASGITLVGCNDTTTGVPTDPAQLLVTKVTYTYPTASGNIFGDTSVPQLCPGNPADMKAMSLDACDRANYSDTATEGHIPAPAADFDACCLDYFKDSFSTTLNPAPPLSAEFRVVLNQIPTTMNGKDLETVQLTQAMPENPIYALQSGVVGVSCDECSASGGGDGLPTLSYVLHIDGSYWSADPSGNTTGNQIPFGPAISVYTYAYSPPPFTEQPSPMGLEPDSTYHFSVNPSLTGRGGTAIGALTAQEKFLTTIHTAAFAVNTLGIGAGTDAAPASSTVSITNQMCTSAATCQSGACLANNDAANTKSCQTLANDGVLTLGLDAAAYEVISPDTVVSATFTPTGGMPTPVTAKIGIFTTDGKTCDAGLRTSVFIYPSGVNCEIAPPAPTPTVPCWGRDAAGGPAAGSISVTIDQSHINSLSWKSGAPNGKGRFALAGMTTITATLSGKLGTGDSGYTGPLASGVASGEDCAALTNTGGDMSVSGDMSTPADMSKAGDMSTPGDMKTSDMAIKG